jgi:hypothetical protein
MSDIEEKLLRRIDLLTTTFGHKPKKLYVTPAEIAELIGPTPVEGRIALELDPPRIEFRGIPLCVRRDA